MIRFLRLLVALSTLCHFTTLLQATRPVDDRPNFIIIFCDDMGYADIEPLGAEGYETPHINRMAEEGMLFTDFHVGYAVCSPSRAAINTGCYPKRVSVNGNFGPNSTTGLHPDEWTIAEVLKQQDYATACYGKWHLGHQTEFMPTSQGYDDFYGVPYSHDMWELHPENGSRYNFPILPLYEDTTVIKKQITPEDQKYHTKIITERTVSFIEENKDRPFFVYLPHPMPHVPLYTTDEFAGKTKRGEYGDVIEEIDWSVGQILDALDDNGIRQNTLVVFTSDNGPWLRYGDHGGSAGSLRRGKGTFFEGGYRVPGVMTWPGKIEAGKINDKFVSTIDLLPTFAKLAGAKLPQERPVDGKDIRKLLFGIEGDQYTRDYLYWAGRRLAAVRSGKWKLIFPGTYVVWSGGGGGQPGHGREVRSIGLSLFDLETDVGETTNVIDQHPKIVAKLEKIADQARAEFGEHDTIGPGVRPLGGK